MDGSILIDGQALGDPLLGRIVMMEAFEGGTPVSRRGPADGIADDFQDSGVVIDGIGFVAGLEIKDFACASAPAAAGAEQFAAPEPARIH